MTPKSSTEIRDRRLYTRGQKVFSQGDAGDAAYIVESGRIGIFLSVEDDEDIQLGTIEPGGIFGEMAVIDGGVRMAAAVALESATLVRIPREMFESKLAKTDQFIRAILNIFINNIRSAHTIYIRKPRSLRDYIKMIMTFSDNMKTYVNLIDVSDFSSELANKLGELDRVATELQDLAKDHKDRRHDAIGDREAKGETPVQLLGLDKKG